MRNNVEIFTVDANEDFIAASDYVDAAVQDMRDQGIEVRGAETAAMSMNLRDGETNAHIVFDQIVASVKRARQARSEQPK